MTTQKTEKPLRRRYTDEFKQEALALVTEQGYKVAQAARSLGIGAGLLGRWRKEFEAEAAGSGLNGEECEELKRLRKENRMLRMEKDILKKASAYFAKEMK